MYFDDWIEEDTLWSSLSLLNSLYATYLGVMIAFYFAGRITPKSRIRMTDVGFLVACAGSLIWNIVLVSFMLKAFLLRGDRQTIYGLEDATKQIARVVPLLSWLVAPAIGYYFGNSSGQKSNNHN